MRKETYQNHELSAVNIIHELDKIGWEFEFGSGDELKCKCPVHEDSSPSCSISTTKKVFKCLTAGCGASGDFISFLAYALKSNRPSITTYIRDNYDVENIKTIDPATVETMHQNIWKAEPLKAELYKRGINDDTIRRHRLGVDNRSRITIPIYNKHRNIVNIRKYKPGAPNKDKMKNVQGMGKARLYPIEQLKYETVVIFGGECKALASLQRLNQHGIGCISTTIGEDGWEAEFTHLFKGKKVYLCWDIDKAGRVGRLKIAARVKPVAEWLGLVDLPLDIDKYPTGDINDYWGSESKTTEDFLRLLDKVDAWIPKVATIEDPDCDLKKTKPIVLKLSSVTRAKYTRKLVKTTGIISAMDTTPYIIPKRVDIDCDKNQKGCADCPVYATEPEPLAKFVSLTISPTSSSILDLVDSTKKTKREYIREGLRIPPCKSCKFYERTHYNVEDVRISPQLDISNRISENCTLPAFTISHGLKLNDAYHLTGVMYPHPKTQQAVLLVGETETAEDALDTFSPTPEQSEELKMFQPNVWTAQGLHEKLTDIYEDLAEHVTHIYERQDLHMFIDLAYHSPLLIPVNGRIEKGWVEILVVGDSAQGKSEVVKRIIDHYGLGVKVDVKNASKAGLLGGLSQLGTRWMVQWGTIPRHDRRLVILEELKGLAVEGIGKLTDMRSSGVAEIDMIESRKTHARTRLIALSNPRSDLPLDSYSYGVEAAKELIGSPEDLRRFDAVLFTASAQVDLTKINDRVANTVKPPQKYLSDPCKRLVLWAWTRHENDIIFSESASAAILAETKRLSKMFCDIIPIVDRGGFRYKLARLAASLACRTFSVDEDTSKLHIRECHVMYISQMLERVYSDSVCGYKDFSEAYLSTRKLNDPKDVRSRILSTPFPEDFIEQLIHTNLIEVRDMCDWTGWDRESATSLLSFLVRKHALLRDNRAYRKNPSFIALLREILLSDALQLVKRPEHIKERLSHDAEM